MPTSEDIEHQQNLLKKQRRNIAHLYAQAAQYGGVSSAPLNIVNNILDVHVEIHRLKATLRQWNIPVEDMPQDSSSIDSIGENRPFNPPLDTIPPPSSLPAGSRMPFHRNDFFVGREEELKKLAKALSYDNKGATGRVAAITGIGGIGKTQFASEFIYRFGSFFSGGVFWLNFANSDGVLTEIARCGDVDYMNLRPDFHRLKVDEQVGLVRRAWQEPVPRLLIFDNCEDEELLIAWRPTSGGCSVCITSRRGYWDSVVGIVTIPLDTLHQQESIALLQNYCTNLSVDDKVLMAIANELGDLPLALHLAGSFMKRYRYTIAPETYLQELRRLGSIQHISLEGQGQKQSTSPTGHEQHIAQTFELSYKRLLPVSLLDKQARILLDQAAYFTPGEPIPRDMLLLLLHLTDNNSSIMLQAEDALTRLIELGLLDIIENGAIRVHRLLATFIRSRADISAAYKIFARRCADEMLRFYRKEHSDTRFSYELFRRALEERSEVAWEYIYNLYKPLVISWIKKSLVGTDIPRDEYEDLTNSIFMSFYRTMTPERFAALPSLALILDYLRRLSESTNYRGLIVGKVEGGIYKHEPASEDIALDTIAKSEFWMAVNSLLTSEAESVVVYRSFILGMKPSDIYASRPDLFASIANVYSLKRNILVRLRRNINMNDLLG